MCSRIGALRFNESNRTLLEKGAQSLDLLLGLGLQPFPVDRAAVELASRAPAII
jgi:hypothetical protein